MSAHIELWAGALPVTRMHGEASTECRCGYSLGRLTRRIYRNGSQHVRWECLRCGDFNSFQYIPHSFLDEFGIQVEDLPVCQDDLLAYGSPDYEPCVVCGEPGTEWHHWAPRSIFSTLPEWSNVGAALCVKHHREWHARMRAHGLRYPHELAVDAA